MPPDLRRSRIYRAYRHRRLDSFLAGTVSILCLFEPRRMEWPEGVHWDDAEALRSDWVAVGDYLWSALRASRSLYEAPQKDRLFDTDAVPPLNRGKSRAV